MVKAWVVISSISELTPCLNILSLIRLPGLDLANSLKSKEYEEGLSFICEITSPTFIPAFFAGPFGWI